MPDHRDLPEPYNQDDDVPFRLPEEDPNVGLSTEDIRAQDQPSPSTITGDFEVLDDQDVPFKLSKTSQSASPDEPTVPYDKDETDELDVVDGKPVTPEVDFKVYEDKFDDENDVPFKLPHNEDNPDAGNRGRIINKMMTMPHQSSPQTQTPDDKKTLPGSGGYDPNPDFANYQQPEPTMKNQRVQAPPPATGEERFRRQQQAPTQNVGQYA
ncbi:MAG TPA: hypothetical protein VHL11_22905, partial [Phototrophicaceae bacterium]|nr:hypothetical protein [Phototrophicaceae bacterium]